MPGESGAERCGPGRAPLPLPLPGSPGPAHHGPGGGSALPHRRLPGRPAPPGGAPAPRAAIAGADRTGYGVAAPGGGRAHPRVPAPLRPHLPGRPAFPRPACASPRNGAGVEGAPLSLFPARHPGPRRHSKPAGGDGSARWTRPDALRRWRGQDQPGWAPDTGGAGGDGGWKKHLGKALHASPAPTWGRGQSHWAMAHSGCLARGTVVFHGFGGV